MFDPYASRFDTRADLFSLVRNLALMADHLYSTNHDGFALAAIRMGVVEIAIGKQQGIVVQYELAGVAARRIRYRIRGAFDNGHRIRPGLSVSVGSKAEPDARPTVAKHKGLASH